MSRTRRAARDLVSVNVRRAHDPLPTFRRWWRRVVPDRLWFHLQWLKLKFGLRRFGIWLDNSWFAMFPRHHPAIALWVFVFICFGLAIEVWTGPPPKPEFVPTEDNRCVETAARLAVNRSLAVIGHGVSVSRVVVKPIGEYAAAEYCDWTGSVAFSNEYFPSSDQLLHTAAHESVHALFDQANLNPYSSDPAWGSRLVVEEVAAEVLGAHIAGRVMTLRGGDGEALTGRLVREFRDACDMSVPGNLRRRIWFYATRHDFEKRVPDLLYSIAIHHGPVEMVDEMDEICREHRDPWEAAHVIADRLIEPIENPEVAGQPMAG